MTSITRRDVLLDALAGAVAAGLFSAAASANATLDGKEWETNWIIDHRRVKG